MIEHRDGQYYTRSAAHIELSNEQMKQAAAGHVAASMTFATARFNAWLCAAGCNSAEELTDKRARALETYLQECRRMFEHHMDDHVQNFDTYMRPQNAG